jgi:hypothetical protein
MTSSTLIKQLQDMEEEYGEDLPVFFADGEGIEYAIDGVTGDYHVCYSEKWEGDRIILY